MCEEETSRYAPNAYIDTMYKDYTNSMNIVCPKFISNKRVSRKNEVRIFAVFAFFFPHLVKVLSKRIVDGYYHVRMKTSKTTLGIED